MQSSTSIEQGGAAQSSMLLPGKIFADKYRIEGVLGEGGMGVVVAAHHIHLDERVAIKFLRPEIADQEIAAERFMREARAATKAKHENIARILDVGTHDRVLYMVMEYLEGESLGAYLEDNGRVTTEIAIDLLLQTCAALNAAHTAGIVHRDLKPENLYLTKRSDGRHWVKVLDFGISKVEDGSMRMTNTSTLLGSPLYMSPEQLMDPRNVDRRTDIWALGIILYEILTGEHPFKCESLPQLCVLVRETEPESVQSKNPTVPQPLEAIIKRCLAKAPNQRFQQVVDLARALREVSASAAAAPASFTSPSPSVPSMSVSGSAPSMPVSGPASSGALGSTPAMMTTGSTTAYQQQEHRNRSRLAPFVVGAVVLAFIGLALGGYGWKTRRAKADTTAGLTPATTQTSATSAAALVPSTPNANVDSNDDNSMNNHSGVVEAPRPAAAPSASAAKQARAPTGATTQTTHAATTGGAATRAKTTTTATSAIAPPTPDDR